MGKSLTMSHLSIMFFNVLPRRVLRVKDPSYIGRIGDIGNTWYFLKNNPATVVAFCFS